MAFLHFSAPFYLFASGLVDLLRQNSAKSEQLSINQKKLLHKPPASLARQTPENKSPGNARAATFFPQP